MVGRKKCYVPHCGHRKRLATCSFFSFPTNPSRCKEWVRKVGVEDFIYQPIETLHKLRFVCSCHFAAQDFGSQLKKRLKNTAVPSILDNSIQELSDEMLNDFPIKKTVIPMTSFQVKIPSEDLENMKQCKTVLKETKQDEASIPQKKCAPRKRYYLSVATKRTTYKKLLEDAGIPGAEMTHDVKQLLQLLQREKGAKGLIQKELDKYVILAGQLQDKLNRYQKNEKLNK